MFATIHDFRRERQESWPDGEIIETGAGPIRPAQATKGTETGMSMHHRTITAATRTMSVQQALEWAFATEKAQIDFDQYGAHQFDRVGIDPLWRAMRLAEVGCVVDGGGSSDPHPDATIIAGAVEAVLPRKMALTVVELARARRPHAWEADATPRIVPHAWHMTDDGNWTAETRKLEEVTFIDRKSRVKRYRPEVCPIRYAGGARVIGEARRVYLDWYGALLEVATHLRRPNALLTIEITDDMPPLSPWNQ